MEGNRDIVFDEESVLLIRQEEPKYVLHSQDSYLSSTVATDSASSSSMGDDEGEEDEEEIDAIATPKCSRCLGLWEAYYSSLTQYPLLIKSLTAFVLLGFADVIAQCIELVRDSRDQDSIMGFNSYRVARFGFFGLAGAPWTHFYYAWLDTVLPPTQNPWTWTTASKF